MCEVRQMYSQIQSTKDTEQGQGYGPSLGEAPLHTISGPPGTATEALGFSLCHPKMAILPHQQVKVLLAER